MYIYKFDDLLSLIFYCPFCYDVIHLGAQNIHTAWVFRISYHDPAVICVTYPTSILCWSAGWIVNGDGYHWM